MVLALRGLVASAQTSASQAISGVGQGRAEVARELEAAQAKVRGGRRAGLRTARVLQGGHTLPQLLRHVRLFARRFDLATRRPRLLRLAATCACAALPCAPVHAGGRAAGGQRLFAARHEAHPGRDHTRARRHDQ